MTKAQIRELALANGFKLKKQPNGSRDLNPYVYYFAYSLLQYTRDYASSKVDPDDLAEDYDLAIAEFARSIKDEP